MIGQAAVSRYINTSLYADERAHAPTQAPQVNQRPALYLVPPAPPSPPPARRFSFGWFRRLTR